MKKVWFTPLVICSLVFFTYHHSLATGVDPESSELDSIAEMGTEEGVETPEFSNPAQAAHAANLAEVAASAPDETVDNAKEDVETAETDLGTAQEGLNAARAGVVTIEKELELAELNLENTISYRATVHSAYKALGRNPTPEETTRYTNAMNQARRAVFDAEATVLTAEEDLEIALGGRKTARADWDMAEEELAAAEAALETAVSELTGVFTKAISDMRDDKMGWGQIAHALGVHPRALGVQPQAHKLGHNKKKGKNFEGGFIDEPEEDLAGDLPALEFEIAEATKRDTQHGWAKDHGMVTSVDSGGKKGLGLSSRDLGVGSKGAKNSKENSSSSRSNSSNSSSNSGKSNSSKGNSTGSSADNSRSDRSSTGGPSSDKSNNGQGSDKSKADKSNNGKSNNSGGKSK